MSQFEFVLAREAQLMYRRAKEFEPVSGNLSTWRGSIPGRGHYKDIKFEVEILIPPDFPRTAPKVTVITPSDHPQVDPRTGNLTLRILAYWRPEYHLYQVINSIKGLFARIPPKLPDTFSSHLPVAPVRENIPKETRPLSSPQSTHVPPMSAPQTRPKKAKAKKKLPVTEIPEETPKVKELKTQISDLESELASLQGNLMEKTEEVARLEGQMDVHNVPRTGPDRINQILQARTDKGGQILDLQSEKIALEDLIQTIEKKFEVGEITSVEYAKLYKSYQKQLHLVNKKLKELGTNQ